MQKGQCLLTKNVLPIINLEITVPRIALPLSKQRWQQVGDGDKQSTTEQVHIVPLGLHSGGNAGQRDERTAEISPAKIQKGRFHIFQVKDVAAQGRAFLLQILRPYKAGYVQERGDRRGQVEQFRPTDNLAFSLTFRSSSDPGEISQVERAYSSSRVTPGLNAIVIFLDEEGKPGGYSIDGAES